MNEGSSGFEGAPPAGSRVTIDFDPAMVPAASSLFPTRHCGAADRCEERELSRRQFLWTK